MTVSELIDALSNQDPDAIILVASYDGLLRPLGEAYPTRDPATLAHAYAIVGN